MSAFILEDSSISQIARSLVMTGLVNNIDERELARSMAQLNARAVNERYTDPQDFAFRFVSKLPINGVRLYKALRCFLYQCSEGTVPESPLYKTLELAAVELADRIIAATDEYRAAPWGA